MPYDNKGRLALWRNKDRKEQTHPHLAGQGEDLNGNTLWVSAWFSKDLAAGDKAILADMVARYEGTSQKPFINIVVKPKEQAAAQPGNGYENESPDDEDVPF